MIHDARNHGMRPHQGPCLARAVRCGFTLIELLVVISIISILASMLLPALARARQSARAVQCLQQMRQIDLAVRMYAEANQEQLPRSQHSAVAYGQLPWGRAISAELGQKPASWTNLLHGIYRCPSDRRNHDWSYGQNVYFELDPGSDDYVGSPEVWRKLGSVNRPSATILDAENLGGADHIMSHFWTSASDAADVATNRHGNLSHYSFIDGHAEPRLFRRVFDPGSQVDAWNPSLAR